MNLYKKIRNISLIAGLSTATIYLINKFTFYFTTLQELLHSKYGNTYSWRFGNIFYTKQGKGPALLCIHDLNEASSEYEFKKIKDELAKTHTLYTIDLLGCGRSDKPRITYTSYMYVQLINDFIKNIIGTKTSIIASGKSSSLAFLACQTDDTLFDQFIMINPENMIYTNKYPSKRKKMRKYLLECPIIGTLIYNILHTKHNIIYRLKHDYFFDSSKITPNMVHISLESCHTSGSDSKYLYSSLVSDYLSCNIVPSVKQIDHNIYFIIGSKEKNATNTMEQYQVLNPSIEGSYVKNTKHLPHLEDARAVLKICKMFLS